MTTIAWRDGVLAADRLAVTGGMKTTVPKLHKLRDGRVVACAGAYRLGLRFLGALRRGETVKFSKDEMCEFQAVVMLPNGKLVEYEDGETPMPVSDPFYAIGSGAHAAMAAMYCGRGAREAVLIAGRVDNGTGGRVDSVTAPKRRPKS